MATPRQAAAAASAKARAKQSGQDAGDDDGSGGGKKEKAKVDWDDVAAKARREAMWLLEFRKQQAAQAEAFSFQKPVKKRRRKASSKGETPVAPAATLDPVPTDAREETAADNHPTLPGRADPVTLSVGTAGEVTGPAETTTASEGAVVHVCSVPLPELVTIPGPVPGGEDILAPGVAMPAAAVAGKWKASSEGAFVDVCSVASPEVSTVSGPPEALAAAAGMPVGASVDGKAAPESGVQGSIQYGALDVCSAAAPEITARSEAVSRWPGPLAPAAAAAAAAAPLAFAPLSSEKSSFEGPSVGPDATMALREPCATGAPPAESRAAESSLLFEAGGPRQWLTPPPPPAHCSVAVGPVGTSAPGTGVRVAAVAGGIIGIGGPAAPRLSGTESSIPPPIARETIEATAATAEPEAARGGAGTSLVWPPGLSVPPTSLSSFRATPAVRSATTAWSVADAPANMARGEALAGCVQGAGKAGSGSASEGCPPAPAAAPRGSAVPGQGPATAVNVGHGVKRKVETSFAAACLPLPTKYPRAWPRPSVDLPVDGAVVEAMIDLAHSPVARRVAPSSPRRLDWARGGQAAAAVVNPATAASRPQSSDDARHHEEIRRGSNVTEGATARREEDKGMCLLAAAAVRRALQEAGQQQFQQGQEQQQHGGGMASASATLVVGRSVAGSPNYVSGDSPSTATGSVQGSALGFAGGEAEAKATTSAGRKRAAAGGGVAVASVSGRGSQPSSWRPQQLRFIVARKRAVGDGAAVAVERSSVAVRPVVSLQGERRGNRTPDARWHGMPRIPGFPLAEGERKGGGGDIGGGGGGEADVGAGADAANAGHGTMPWRRIKRGGGDGGSCHEAPAPRDSKDNASLTSAEDCTASATAATAGGFGFSGSGSGGFGFSGSGSGGFNANGGDGVEDLGLPPVGRSAATAPSLDGSEGGGAADAAFDWDEGRYSLRWLPSDGLAALQAAGAAGGMTRVALDAPDAEAAAASAAEAAEAAFEIDESAIGGPPEDLSMLAEGGPVMWGYDGYYDGGAARKKRKVKRRAAPRRKRETHVLVSESDGEEAAGTSTSVWAGLEEAAKAEAKALLSYRNSGMVEAEADDNQHWVRRSVRAAGASALDYPHVAKLLEQIRTNDPEVEVLKLHHYLGPDVNTAVINAVLEALSTNTNCQALYIQNFNEGFRDEQVAALAKVLRRGKIWCLNAGENYKVNLSSWWEFVEEIKSTNVTHAYLSEHVITPDLKNAMRKAIRDNRVKHTRHKKASNLEVIRRCTNMWWNPINSKELQAELKVMDASYEGMEPAVPSPAAMRVPCSLHGPDDKPPASPDLTDCPVRPRGPCVFRDG